MYLFENFQIYLIPTESLLQLLKSHITRKTTLANIHDLKSVAKIPEICLTKKCVPKQAVFAGCLGF